jgi:hypothetical protein
LARVAIPDSVTNIATQAFSGCNRLTNVTIGAGVRYIELMGFGNCPNLKAVYFMGDAPDTDPGSGFGVFSGSEATIYYLPGTSGWGPIFADRPALLWNPEALTNDGSFGLRTNQFGFNITGTPNIPVSVEAASDQVSPAWLSLQTLTLTNGLVYFTDPECTNYPTRFYRIRSP